MDSFWLAFGIVMPMFLTMMTGWALRHFGVLEAEGFDNMNTLSFKLLLPLSLFQNIYYGGKLDFTNARMLSWALISHGMILALLFMTVPRLFPENPVRASIIQSCFRSNFITFGLVIAAEFCGDQELAVVSILAGMMIPVYNIGGIFILEYYRGGRMSAGRMVIQILRNPFVISCAAAILLSVTGVKLPVCVESTVKSIASCAVPVSFVALGGSLSLADAGKYKKELLYGVGWRLVVQPAVFLSITCFLGFRGIEFLAVMVMLISPTAVATYNMARSMDADGDLAGYLVVFQSLGSIITIFLWIYALNLTGWIRV